MEAEPVIDVSGLTVRFDAGREVVGAIEDVSFAIRPGETLALVGESGCGKSVTSLALLGLLPRAGRIAGGEVRFRGWDGGVLDLAAAAEAVLRKVRGAGIGIIFQEPMTALNPTLTVGFQIAETLLLHQKLTRSQAWTRAGELMAKVGIADPERRLCAYPHQLSGGMRQRVVIAMAIACRPALMIADEPTTALDVTTQAQVLRLLRDLQAEIGMGMLFITHDLALASMIADRVMVMYAGQIVETGTAAQVIAAPSHPYTRALLECLPARRLPRPEGVRERLPTIEGAAPSLVRRPEGCAFAGRCADAADVCRQGAPRLLPVGQEGRASRCVRLAVA
jgi:oligopeptide/dipeptide ABC transporter ATP-binding protein